MANTIWQPLPKGAFTLTDSELLARAARNREYMLSLREEALLQNFLFEAGMRTDAHIDENLHGGWESPTCQLRGHFLGHYLSACAYAWKNYGDAALKGRGESIVRRLARCQKENGEGWVFSIPRTYLQWLERKKRVWAPHYTLHKTLMGLADMAKYADSREALDVLIKAADWFYDWSGHFTREQFSDMLDVETGGMMEAWADLYALTGDEKHLTLMRRYERPRLYDALLGGGDPLTYMHANTTIPEMHGVMRAYEVTGESRYMDILRAYWLCAVDSRGHFATGGQTCDEFWTPKGLFAEFLGSDNQEHCTVYNLILVANFLLRHTGDVRYADYAERNFINGILAQQHAETGMVAYYLPMHAGAKVHWGTPTKDFWCCHGTLVQAHARHGENVCFETPEALCIAQYFAFACEHAATKARVTLSPASRGYYAIGANKAPAARRCTLWRVTVTPGEGGPLQLRLRMPWWLSDDALLRRGEEALAQGKPGQWLDIDAANGEYLLELPYALSCQPLPDKPDTVAFMEGPNVLVGETTKNAINYSGNPCDAHTLLRRVTRSPYDNRHDFFEASIQGEGVRFFPLRRLEDERFTMYFTIKPDYEKSSEF